MKKLLFLSTIVTILFSCNNTHNKKTSYKTTDWMVAGITNPNTGDGALGWGKMVVYTDSTQYKEDTASNGDVTKKKSIVSDTFYILRTPDFSCPMKDSTGKQVNDPNNHSPLFYLSWRNAQQVSKDMLKPIYQYPANVLAQMVAALPKPDSTYKPPVQQVVVPAPTAHPPHK